MASSSALSVSLLLLSLFSGEFLAVVNGQRTWCVAKPSSNEQTLLANINYACSQVDCRILRRDCPCFSPDNLISHASVAMNLYYRANGCNKWNCDFRNSGLIVLSDPSYEDCVYE
ncbi:hypothetical protein Nepgr_026084 [Nepenthes gracilis]|uniref:X8 domain-containing protein n=1 Tax=Nepenthes gracilis TaxID=150966 RepID=A0AAD3Y249_NEPGR|nr:hypothetical protein Nepgr_026084 [Nepenthes gracilis]